MSLLVACPLLALATSSPALQPERLGSEDLEAALARRTDGCTHVFVDAGSNIGMHARFLFEPTVYPNSTFVRVFDRFFGPSPRDNSRICAVEFEPNPRFKQRYERLTAAYADQGWRVIHAPYAVSDDAGGGLTFYRNDAGGANQDWGFGVVNHNGTASEAINVSSIDFSRFLLALNERQPYSGDAPSARRTVVKMDIEGAEFFTLPHAINSGAHCTGVDYLSAEFHEFLARHIPLSFPDHGVELPTQQAAETLRDSLRRTIRGLPAHCRLHNVDNMDDEAYLNDRSHAQLEAPSVRA